VVAATFTACQLLFVPSRMGLSWDETVYVSQVSGHASAAFFDAARSRGVPLLVAPVTMLTSSVVVLRVYLALLSGLGLLGPLWTWRPLRPAWVLALAGVAFGSLWVALYYGPQAMPDDWMALTALGATGVFLRAATRQGQRGALVGLTLTMALAALLRPGDAAFLVAPLVLATLAVPGWRRWRLSASLVAGAAAGAAEWVVEAYLRFGGLPHRLLPDDSASSERAARPCNAVSRERSPSASPGSAGRRFLPACTATGLSPTAPVGPTPYGGQVTPEIWHQQPGDGVCRMGFVRNPHRGAWVPHGRGLGPLPGDSLRSSSAIGVRSRPRTQGGSVLDLLYIGLTIVVFAALWLLVKGVERFER
jgi:hypothetical protein